MTKLTIKSAEKMMANNSKSLYLRGTGITQLPDNLSVGGSLYLRGTGITQLPDNLSVGGSLYLRGTGITQLPDNLSVGGSLYLEGTGIPFIYHDKPRGYKLYVVSVGDGMWYVAGCRLFKTAESALSHWGSDNYPNKGRGDEYCDAIKREVKK